LGTYTMMRHWLSTGRHGKNTSPSLSTHKLQRRRQKN
jgi:hypothetical protein